MYNPYSEDNILKIQQLQAQGPGIYNSYDDSCKVQEGGQGISVTYPDASGQLHTYYFTVVVGENVDSNATVNIDAYGSGMFEDGRHLDTALYAN